ncbi:hypothetical protein JCM5296_003686 [Sporobolomyces johnsonii]
MVAHKTKTLSLPHLSLSRTSANSRNASPATTPTSTTPTPLDDAPPFGHPFDRKKSKSSSPKQRTLDPVLPLEKDLSRDALKDKDKDKRRSSFGASLSAFSSGGGPRSSSPAPKSPSTPAGLTLTPASGVGAGGRSMSESSTSGGVGGGLKPLRAVIAKSAAANGHGGDAGGALPARSKSSDRIEEKERKKGVMGAVRGLALGHSVSQPGSSRSASSGFGTGGGAHDGLASSGGAGSPVLGGGVTPGTATPSVAASSTAGQPQLHQLAESYVSKVSLRLGEAVNRVFLPGQGGVAGAQADKLEGVFFVGAAAAQGAFGGKGRASPRVVRSREVGELVFSELQAALHDHYLLRTLLRSSVLKALSLFLTRLSALLLVPSSPSESLFLAPLSLSSPPSSSKDPDFVFASHFPLPLRYNLHIVRCASEVKRHLLRVADPANGFPSFVEETLRPWRVKLGELIARVMGPVVAGYRLAVSEACAKARVEGASADGSEGPGAAAGGEALGLHVPKPSATSQLRSLSLGRGAPAAAGSTPSSTDHSHATAAAGPSWLRDATAVLDVAAKLFVRLDAKGDADKWAVSIATAAVWKGMLGCAARVISAPEDESTAQAVVVPQPTVAATTRNRLLGGVKKTPSPPASPDLPSVDLAAPSSSIKRPSPPASSAIAFVRLISDLELLEQRLSAFLTASLSSPSTVFAPSAPPAGACPGGGACGLCKTGRTFDPESDSSSDEDDDLSKRGPAAGRESRLALSAMREAMQALSAMIVVVRASKDLKVLGAALSSSSTTAAAAQAPLTPSALFALPPSPSPSPHTTTTPLPSTSITLTSLSPINPLCATLHSALLELPPLILLHLVLSRVPRTLGLRLPHELWALRGGWREYEAELRGFAAGEEWAGEVGWEVRGEVARVEGERGEKGMTEREREAVAVLQAALAKVGTATD